MTLVVKDRVKETCTGTSGNMALAGAVSGFVAFDIDATFDGNTTYYAIEDADGTKWEVGLGTLSADSTSIVRTTILATQVSLTDTTRQTFSGGAHTIFCTYPAGKAVHLDALGNLSHTVDISADTNLAAGTGITLTGDILSTTDGEIVHDNLSGFVPNEHLDWTGASAGTIHATNYTDTDTVYALPEATSTAKGGIELFSDTDQSVAATAVSTTASRTYGLQLNAAGQGVVNVPWVDTNTTYTVGDGGLTTNDFTDADHSKLNAIEASADVTDATNVTAAGALMDSELAGIAAVKATTGTFLTADQTKLDGIAASANNYTLPSASATTVGGVELATTGETTTGTDTARAVTPAGVQAAIDALIGGAPGALDTLNELAAAINDDASYASTITTALGLKATLASPTFTGTIAIPNVANLETAVVANTAKVTNVSTNLATTTSTTTAIITSSDGTDATIPVATTSVGGVMSKAIFDQHTANVAKVSNATHTGDVTGGTALTIATDAVDIAMLSATGTASSSTFLRGDNTWVTPTDTNTEYTKASFDLDHLFTLVDAAADTSEHLGTFTGGTISDSVTIKAALQALETAVETKGVTAGSSSIVTVGTIGTGTWQGTAIATAYIADDAITGAKIALFDDSLAATTTHFLIADGTDYSSFVLSGDVTCTNAGVVTVADDAIDSEHYTDGSIDHVHLAADCIDGDNIQDDVINSEHIAAASIDNEHLADDAVDSDELAAGAIDTAHIGDDQVTADKLANSINTAIAANTAKATNVSTNLSATANGTSLTVESSDGTNVALPAATTSAWGIMSDDQATKLDGIEASADVTDATNVTAAGALMDSELAGIAAVKATTGTFLTADQTKLDAIEASADVTDATNVTAAGALMDSEVTNLAFVKALAKGISDGNVLTANDVVADDDFLRINGTEVEGLTVAEVLTALNVEAAADVTDTANVTAAGALMDSELAGIAAVKATTGTFLTADQTKLDAIEASADVTDATNVTAAGALMDSECAGLAALKATTGTFLSADQTKLDGIAASATADQTAGEILTLLEDGIDSVHYKDGSIDNAHIADDAIDSEHYADGSIDNAHIADDAIDSEHYAAGSIDTAHIADDQITLAKMAGITRGSIIIGDASGDPAALAIGSSTYVLTSDGTDIAWASGGDITAVVAGDGMTGGATSGSATVNVIGGDGITANANDVAVTPAQTTITSLLAADIKIGEDDQTKIDFETADEIHFYAANVEQVYLADNIFGPQSDSDVDLGTTGVRWKDAYIDTITTTGAVFYPLANAEAEPEDATVTIDLRKANYFDIELGANVTNINLLYGKVGQRFMIRFEQDASANYSIAWNAVTNDFDGGGDAVATDISWPGGTAPTMTATNDKADTYGFVIRAEGEMDGFVIGQNMPVLDN